MQAKAQHASKTVMVMNCPGRFCASESRLYEEPHCQNPCWSSGEHRVRRALTHDSAKTGESEPDRTKTKMMQQTADNLSWSRSGKRSKAEA